MVLKIKSLAGLGRLLESSQCESTGEAYKFFGARRFDFGLIPMISGLILASHAKAQSEGKRIP